MAAIIATTAPITPLRQRMLHDMMIRGPLPRTQDPYVRHVQRFAAYLGRPPDTATPEGLRNFQIQQHETGASAGTINGAGSVLTHHPHVHMIVPGGGIAPDGTRWISSRGAFLLPVRVLGALLRRLFLTRLLALFDTGKLGFHGTMAGLAERKAFLRHLSPIRKKRWVVYAKPPFAGPQAVLAYLSRYTHRVAISNRRLIAFDEAGVTFRYKDYRRDSADRQQVMTLATDEFIRRFLIHVLPRGFHRIRHYGPLASSAYKDNMALARRLLCVAPPAVDPEPDDPPDHRPPCPCCGGQMTIIETFARWRQPRAPPAAQENGP